MPFKRATKRESKLRLALIGPSGSGKTYSALAIAKHLGGRVALVDTERGSASKYGDLFDFDVLELESFSPEQYMAAVAEAEKAGYDILIMDSLSHAWAGKDGLLEFVDKVAKRTQSANSFGAWREATPLHNKLVDTIIGARLHVIATMRAKMEYVQEKDDKGKTVIRKVGLQPVQRDGLEYEFDVVADLTQENDLIVSKTRCPQLNGKVINKPGKEIADVLRTWLSDAPATTPPPPPAPAPPIPPSGQPTTTFEDLERPEEQPSAADTPAAARQRVEQLIKDQARTLAHVQTWVAENWGLKWNELQLVDWQRLEKSLKTKKTNGQKVGV